MGLRRWVEWLRGEDSPEEKACRMVADIFDHQQERENLRLAGWTRLEHPSMVSNEWVWHHPTWHYQLESKAIRILKAERAI